MALTVLLSGVLAGEALRTKLGAIHSTDGSRLEAELQQVVDEVKTTHPDRTIMATIDLQTPAFCDPARIGRVALISWATR